MNPEKLPKGTRVTLRRNLVISMGSPEERKKLEDIRNRGIIGTVIDSESMGEITCYTVDFGDPSITNNWSWERKELFTAKG